MEKTVATMAIACVCVLAASGCTASEADTGVLELNYAGIASIKHPASVKQDQYFIEQVDKLSDGKIHITLYPDGQLGGPESLVDLLKSGAADITNLAPSYAPDELPLSAVAELPAMFESSVEGSRAFDSLITEGGYLYEAEWKPRGLHPLMGVTSAPYEVLTTKKPVKSLDDLHGLKLKTAGGAADTTARLTGSVPVQLTVAETYNALQRGTVDGRYGSFENQPYIGIEDILQYGTIGAHVGGFTQPFVMSQDGWNALTPSQQEIINEAAETTRDYYSSEADKADAQTRKMLVNDHNWKLYKIKGEESNEWAEALAQSRELWAERIDRRFDGHQADKAIREFEAAVDEQN